MPFKRGDFMKAGKILLIGIGALSIYGCAHTGPRPQRTEVPPTATTANDPTTRALGLLQASDMSKASGYRTSAAQLYSDAVNLQPANGVAWFGLGTNYLHQNDIDL